MVMRDWRVVRGGAPSSEMARTQSIFNEFLILQQMYVSDVNDRTDCFSGFVDMQV